MDCLVSRMEYIVEIYEGELGKAHYAGYTFITANSIDEARKEAKIIEAKVNVSHVNVEPYGG